MSILSMLANFFGYKDKQESNVVEEDIEYVYCCPKCGSEQMIYSTIIGNFVQVVSQTEDAKYIQIASCPKCGFRVQGKLDECGDEYLNQLTKRVKGDDTTSN